jgi:hypothetical protein
MPEKQTLKRAQRDKAEGKAPSTQAGEFIREEIHHVRDGKHGARSAKQEIAIGLSKARRAGVDLPPPKRGTVPEKTRRSAKRAYDRGHGAAARRKPSPARSQAVRAALEHESHAAASHDALSRHARASARRRGSKARSEAAARAARTKGPGAPERRRQESKPNAGRAPRRLTRWK